MPEFIRLVDIIDVLAVAALVYGALVWFKQARSRFVLMGVAIVGVLYVMAQTLDLRLMLLVFRAGIAVGLLVLAIIFQEDLRRAFERIATGNPLARRHVTAGAAHLIDTVVESFLSMAKRRVGALLVFRGKEPLDRHLSGGFKLDGEVSFPLIDSIFDPSSQGHDGAVVIEDGLIASFGVRLPLSTHVEKTKSFGTRHTAALGLSERSDALILVASEERGTISVANNGSLDVVDDMTELRERIAAFFEKIGPGTTRSLWSRVFVQNLGAKGLSLAIAIGAWVLLFSHQGETVVRTFNVPIAVHDVPGGFLLEQPEPSQASVTLSGPELAFQDFDSSTLMLSISASTLRSGVQEMPVDVSGLALPEGLGVRRLEPREVSLRAQEAVTKNVAVRVRSTGRLEAPLKLKSLTAEPARVALMIPKGRHRAITFIPTAPIDLSEISSTTKTIRRLKVPPGCRLVDASRTKVDITIEVE